MLSNTPFATPDTPGLVRGKYVTTDGPATADDVREAIMRERLEEQRLRRVYGAERDYERARNGDTR